MVKEAEKNREEDEKRKALADAKNDAEQLINATQKAIKDLGDKVDEKDKEKAEKLIKELEEEMAKDDTEAINKKKDELQEIAMVLATKVYQEAAAKEQAENADSSEESKDDKDDNVKDAEFEEK
jgi:molecular chaperone DnaK